MGSPSVSSIARQPARSEFLDWFTRNRRRSDALFDMLDEATYYERPIALRNPIVFYEGHLPAFNVIVLIKRGLGRPGVDERLETLFARGIDPEDVASAQARGNPTGWPTRGEVARLRAKGRCAHRRCAVACAAFTGRASRARSGRGRAHDARARSDASGDAALHVASSRARSQTRSSRHGATRDRGGATGGAHGRRSRRAGASRRVERSAVRLGQRVRRDHRRRAGVQHRRLQRHQRRLSRVRAGRRL